MRHLKRISIFKYFKRSKLATYHKVDSSTRRLGAKPVYLSSDSAIQARVLDLLAEFKEGPHFKSARGLQHIVQELERWAKDSVITKPNSEVFNFMSHICTKHGSVQDIDMLVSFTQSHGLKLNDGNLNLILSSMASRAGMDRVKQTWNESFSEGRKIRVGTQTDLLQRAISDRDFLFAVDIINSMQKTGNFPSSVSVMDDAIAACVGVQSEETVRVVEGVMGVHNHHRPGSSKHEVGKSTVKAFTTWIKSLPSQYQVNRTSTDNRGICQSCGEQLLCNDLSADEYTHLLHHFEDQVKFKAGTENVSRWSIVRGLRKIAKERIGGPFGAVLDGLNIAQRQCFTRSNPLIDMGKMLVEHTGQQTLLIGRRHMTNVLLKEHERQDNLEQAMDRKYRSYGIHTFLLPNSVHDDYYLIYAALATSKNTLIVSNDEFGDKVCGLPWELGLSFQKWQSGQQLRFRMRNLGVELMYPARAERVVQQTDGGSWHLPLSTSSSNNWLCACCRTSH